MDAVERVIARIAGRQDNVITLEQLLEAGLGPRGVSHRVKARAMQRLYRGVFLLGAAPPTLMARARAAVFACGEGAVVSHRSAAELFGLLPEAGGSQSPATGGGVDVSVVGRNPGAEPGIRLHRPRAIAKADVTSLRGIPVTSIARIVCDLAATESPQDTEQAFQEALFRRIVTPRAVAAVIEREPRRKGAAVVRALLSESRMTRSEKERALLKLIDAAQLPRPLTNVRLHGYLADMYWPAHRLVLEFDGWGAHGHRLAFEHNRKRDQVMLANGLAVMRVTDRHLQHEPVALIARIAQSLRA
jgi:very-short-patch-repair endonuclease